MRMTAAPAARPICRGGAATELESGAVLHVTNGDSAGNLLRQTTLSGAVLPGVA